MKKKIVIIAGIILAAVGIGCFCYIQNQNTEQEGQKLPEGMRDREDVIVATGTTATGLVEKEMEFSFLDTDLIVDEVYVSSADEVEKGAKVLKITDNSLREATRELERAQMEASLAYRQGLIDYETGKLDAEGTLKKSQIESEFAQTVYEDAIAAAEVDVQKAQQEAEDAQEIVEEYTAAIEEDYYYTEYEVEEKKAAYEKNVALFFEKLDDYDYELDDDDDDDPNTFNIVKKGSTSNSTSSSGTSSGTSSTSSGTNSTSNNGTNNNSGSKDGELTVLQLLKSEYQENKEEYDQAVKDYEAATEKAKAGLAQAQDTLQLKLLALQNAQIALEKAKTSAQADYDSTVIKGEKARASYETELKSLSEMLEILADAEEEATENYELFMETIGDGYIYTEKAGTILMIRANENTELSKDGILLAYSDADTIQVTAAVDQSDIAEIEIGETAAVVMEDYGTYTGVVTQINPVSESASKASVSYNVVLDLDGDMSKLSANITTNVYFGMTGEEYDRLQSEREQNKKQRERSEAGDVPDAGSMKPDADSAGSTKPDADSAADDMPVTEKETDSDMAGRRGESK